MHTTFLLEEEIEFLTGYKKLNHQIRWLEDNRLVFLVSANGHPRLSRRHVEERLGASICPMLNKGKNSEFEPDWDAIT